MEKGKAVYKYINRPANMGAPVVLDDPEREAKNARAMEIVRARQADPNYCRRCSRVHRGGPCSDQQKGATGDTR